MHLEAGTPRARSCHSTSTRARMVMLLQAGLLRAHSRHPISTRARMVMHLQAGPLRVPVFPWSLPGMGPQGDPNVRRQNFTRVGVVMEREAFCLLHCLPHRGSTRSIAGTVREPGHLLTRAPHSTLATTLGAAGPQPRHALHWTLWRQTDMDWVTGRPQVHALHQNTLYHQMDMHRVAGSQRAPGPQPVIRVHMDMHRGTDLLLTCAAPWTSTPGTMSRTAISSCRPKSTLIQLRSCKRCVSSSGRTFSSQSLNGRSRWATGCDYGAFRGGMG